MTRNYHSTCVLAVFMLSISVVNAADGSKHNYAFNPLPGAQAAPVAPHPFGSDVGWGGGAKPQQLVDGLRGCNGPQGWDCGLAFTGGNSNWGGQACGMRQATIDLGAYRQISAVRITHHGDAQVPKNYQIQTFNGAAWVVQANVTTNSLARCERNINPSVVATCTITDEFLPITASRVRITYNNCPNANTSIVPGQSLVHGWIYEIEALRLPE